MDVADCIRSRRSVKVFAGPPLPRDEVEALLALATWAPTHRLTQPWRFLALDRAACARLAAWLPTQDALRPGPDPAKAQGKIARLAATLPTLGAMVVTTWLRDADPVIDLEDHAAASAAVQNLLLAATARGLASFWSTSQMLAHPLTLAHLGIDPAREGFLGAIWLGHAAAVPPAPARVALGERVRWV